jgi:hypothetical protein
MRASVWLRLAMMPSAGSPYRGSPRRRASVNIEPKPLLPLLIGPFLLLSCPRRRVPRPELPRGNRPGACTDVPAVRSDMVFLPNILLLLGFSTLLSRGNSVIRLRSLPDCPCADNYRSCHVATLPKFGPALLPGAQNVLLNILANVAEMLHAPVVDLVRRDGLVEFETVFILELALSISALVTITEASLSHRRPPHHRQYLPMHRLARPRGCRPAG